MDWFVTITDLTDYLGILLGFWAIGWVNGYMFLIVRKLFDFIKSS